MAETHPAFVVLIHVETWTAAIFEHFLFLMGMNNEPSFDVLWLSKQAVPVELKEKMGKQRSRKGYGFHRMEFVMLPSKFDPLPEALTQITEGQYEFIAYLPPTLRPDASAWLQKSKVFLEKERDVQLLCGPVLGHPLAGSANQVYRNLLQHPWYSGVLRSHYSSTLENASAPLLKPEYLVMRCGVVPIDTWLLLPPAQKMDLLSLKLQNGELKGRVLGSLQTRDIAHLPAQDCVARECRTSFRVLPRVRRHETDPNRQERVSHLAFLLMIVSAYGVAHWSTGMLSLLMWVIFLLYFVIGVVLGVISRERNLLASLLSPWAILLSGLLVITGVFDLIFHPILPKSET